MIEGAPDLYMPKACVRRPRQRVHAKIQAFTGSGRSGVRRLDADDLFHATRAEHGHDGGLPCLEGVQNLLLDLCVILRRLSGLDEARQVQVVLGAPVLEQEADLAAARVGVQQLVLRELHEGHLHVVGRGAQVLALLAREDVERHDVGLGVAVLPRLRGGDLGDLARVPLDHHVGALPELSGLLGVHVRGPGVGGLEGRVVMFLRHRSLLGSGPRMPGRAHELVQRLRPPAGALQT
mmetsp:Transcript_9989/g.28109  ORF Transcript_9989/g.28109 Transcript_9989/m.28109 type:complete len:236 (+) Transcript_9989:136-843(+)